MGWIGDAGRARSAGRGPPCGGPDGGRLRGFGRLRAKWLGRSVPPGGRGVARGQGDEIGEPGRGGGGFRRNAGAVRACVAGGRLRGGDGQGAGLELGQEIFEADEYAGGSLVHEGEERGEQDRQQGARGGGRTYPSSDAGGRRGQEGGVHGFHKNYYT